MNTLFMIIYNNYKNIIYEFPLTSLRIIFSFMFIFQSFLKNLKLYKICSKLLIVSVQKYNFTELRYITNKSKSFVKILLYFFSVITVFNNES